MRPAVAITGRILSPGRVKGWEAEGIGSPRAYSQAVERAGGIPVLLPPTEITGTEAADRIARFDALLLTGGPDVDPARYGEAAHANTYGVDAMVDEFEMSLLRAALDGGRPVLAICRGLQVLNVAMGGSLEQHLPDRDGLIPHGVPNGGEGASHAVDAEAGSRLAKALGGDRAIGRSHHHQAVARVGDGLLVTASAPDGIVEGLELDGSTWCVAVQWHPEETAGSDPAQQGLFDSLVAQAS